MHISPPPPKQLFCYIRKESCLSFNTRRARAYYKVHQFLLYRKHICDISNHLIPGILEISLGYCHQTTTNSYYCRPSVVKVTYRRRRQPTPEKEKKKLKFPAKIGCRYSVYYPVAYLGFWRCGGLTIVRDQDKNLADFKLNSGSGKY